MRPSYRNTPDRILGIVCRCVGAIVALVLVAALTSLPNYLAHALRPEPRLDAAEAIVVLGGGVQPDGALSSESLPRVMQGIRLYKASLAPLIVFSGAGFAHRPAEAEVAARLARDLGVWSEQILTETGAHTTREEAARIARRLAPRAVRRILLVTDSEHLTRAVALFERIGFEVLPAPADSVSLATRSPEERLQLLRRLGQELMARLYYRLAGYL